jgi:hypothetical protein
MQIKNWWKLWRGFRRTRRTDSLPKVFAFLAALQTSPGFKLRRLDQIEMEAKTFEIYLKLPTPKFF